MISYDDTPVVGYPEGIIVASPNIKPDREFTDRGDLPKGNKQNANDWFTIGDTRYNVHPYSHQFGGYPVRWIEAVIDPAEYRGADYGDD